MQVPTSPLFNPALKCASVSEACEHDRAEFGFDLAATAQSLGLDLYHSYGVHDRFGSVPTRDCRAVQPTAQRLERARGGERDAMVLGF